MDFLLTSSCTLNLYMFGKLAVSFSYIDSKYLSISLFFTHLHLYLNRPFSISPSWPQRSFLERTMHHTSLSLRFLYIILLTWPTLAASFPTSVSVHKATTHTILRARVDITIPPVIIPSVTISEFEYTHSKFSLKSLDLHLPTPTCVQTIIPDKNGHVPPGTCNALWNYYPSFVAAVVTAGIFGAITLVHIGEAIYLKTVSSPQSRKKVC